MIEKKEERKIIEIKEKNIQPKKDNIKIIEKEKVIEEVKLEPKKN